MVLRFFTGQSPPISTSKFLKSQLRLDQAIRHLPHILRQRRGKSQFLSVPWEMEFMRVERMTRQAEHALMFLRPALGDELQIKVRVGPVNFVAADRMPDMREMHPQLMEP